MAGGPEFVRTCAECRRYVFEETGRVKTVERPDADGNVVPLPLLLADYGEAPPCQRCPKIPDDAPERSWEHAYDFEPWVMGCVNWFRECKAVGDFGRPGPAMRAVAAAVADHFETLARQRTAEAVAAAVLLARPGSKG